MKLEILEKASDDPCVCIVKNAVAEYAALSEKLTRENIHPEFRERELAELRNKLTDDIERHRRDLLTDAEGELSGLRETYLKKMEKPSDVLARIEEYRIKYSPLTDEALDQAAHGYITGASDILDRVEITSLTGELERRGSKRLGDFREAVARRGGLEPWNKLAPTLVERKAALERAQYGSLPINVKSANGNQAYMEIPIGDFLK